MKTAFPALVTGVIAFAAAPSMAPAQTMEHKVVPPQQIEWAPAPASIPAGAQAALLHGDPTREGLFVLRLKLPAGYHVPPHKHPATEVVTVISGTFRLGSGETADPGKVQPLPAGSFFAFSPGMVHYAYTDEETVVQISTNGPWGITYVNPKDDPRQKSQ
jgi:quercetin dioxygenase-like cupin family protein